MPFRPRRNADPIELDYEPLTLKDQPLVTGYLVGRASENAPPNGYLAVFLVQGDAAVQEFVHYGVSIEVEDGRRDEGYRRIKGQERVSVTEWHEDEYAWNGSRYVLVRAAVHGQPLWKAPVRTFEVTPLRPRGGAARWGTRATR